MPDGDPILQMPGAQPPAPGVVSPLAGRILTIITVGIFVLLIVALLLGKDALVAEIIADCKPLVLAAGAVFLTLINPSRRAP